MNLQQDYIKETNKSYLRKNKKNGCNLDYNIRKDILLKYEPFKVITFSNNEEAILDAYLFNKNDKIVVVIEQISGNNYSKILILNYNDDIVSIIKKCIKNDRNKDIIRISHTTEEKYNKILDIIFDINEKKYIRKKLPV